MADSAVPAAPRGRLRALLVAAESSATALTAALAAGGFEPVSTRVETADDLARSLASEAFDVAICDDGLSDLGGPAILRAIKATRPDLPTIVVSATFGESIAAAAMKAGADDFIAQGYLARLVPAVEREVRAAEARRGRESSEQLYRDLMEQSHVLVCVHDLEGRVLAANPAAAENLGFGATAAIPPGLRIQDFLASGSKEDFDRYIAKIRRDGVAKGLMTVRTATGEERYWEYRNTLRKEGGDQPLVRGFAFDVTDRIRAEQDLREARQFSDEIIAGAGEGIIVYGPDLRYRVWNPFMEELTGLSALEVVGREPREVFPDAMERFDFNGLLDRALAGETVSSGAIPFRVPATGRAGWASMSYAPHRSHDGRIVGVIGIVQDVTQRRLLEEQFLQSQKMEAIGRLAGGIAHDFNNLLTAILGYTDLLLAQVSSEDPMRADLEEIARAGERAASLTRQLLAFSRRQMLEPKLFDVGSVVTSLERLLRQLIGEDVVLVTRSDPQVNLVRADPGQLEQVLVNLAVNSRDAMPSGGTITIETHRIHFGSALEVGGFAIAPGPYVRIDFRDTGEGMDGPTLARIFEPFFTTKEHGKGTGLGLSTAYGIVKQSGGYIVCESERGRGTLFQIYLPRSLDEPVPVEADGLGPLPPPGGSETVLLVEDEEGVRRLARKLLEAHGYQVLEAAGGAQAIELATRFPGPIHLVLTDIVMPELDGTQVASRIRELRPEIRVLYMSGHSEEAPAQLAGESALLVKPFTSGALAQRVREALAS